MTKLVVSDLSNIEGRVLAWVAGEGWKLEAFREYDAGTGPDLYNTTATSIIGGDPWKVPKKKRNIFGKVPDLACFGRDTRVLTDNGYKAIVGVLKTDRLWDGTEWVKHAGVIDRGVRQVVSVDGIDVTPDHLIRIEKTWKQAQLLASDERILYRALETGSACLPLRALSTVRLKGFVRSKCDAIAVRIRTALNLATSYAVNLPAVISAPSKLREIVGRDTLGTLISSRMKSIDGACSIASPRALTAVGIPTTQPTLTTGAAVFKCSLHGSKIGESFFRISSHWTAGIFRDWNSIGGMWIGAMNRVISASSPNKRIDGTSVLFANCKSASTISKRVYDIALVGPRNRFTIRSNSGHLLVHNCGYGGGVNAFQTFVKAYIPGETMSDYWGTIQENIDAQFVKKATENYNEWGTAKSDLPPKEWIACETIKLPWRARHKATVKLWKAVEAAARSAIQMPGETFTVGRLKIGVRKKVGKKYLLIKLPSGKYLCYFDPRYSKEVGISYMGMGTENSGSTVKAWVRLFTWGGKLVENIVQAIARDILYYNMPAAEAAGFAIVLHVHDEDVTEAADDKTADELSAIIATPPPWAKGLPLAAAGFEAFRYKKED